MLFRSVRANKPNSWIFILILVITSGLLLSGCSAKSSDNSVATQFCNRWAEFSKGVNLSVTDKSSREIDYQYRLATTHVAFIALVGKHERFKYLNDSIENLVSFMDKSSEFNADDFIEFNNLCDSLKKTQETSSETTTPSESDVSKKGTASESTNSDDNCLKLEVESPYDSADFYAFQVYITNTCSYRVSLKGYFYVKTENGGIYERPSDSIINFHGNNICGITGNYLDYTFNPGSTGEYSSDSVCNSVRSGDTVVSYFIANDPDGKPSLELNGRWTLN